MLLICHLLKKKKDYRKDNQWIEYIKLKPIIYLFVTNLLHEEQRHLEAAKDLFLP